MKSRRTISISCCVWLILIYGFRVKNILLNGPLDAVCGVNIVYLAMNGNDLSNYEDVRILADSAVNSALMKVTDMERRMKILEILAENPKTDLDATLYDALKKNLVNYVVLANLS
ncbi:hypothetical protein RclHR1_01960008 [Rhizophagus clarus]|uniref:Uncharacterized protein n=1 Tax=Rhizophagus clarus TaxID=94130 RepID=A0A2Z6RHU0_9GLOM|nr:hypothetical protein RclHR1_01960008 [Rhizophagus clarus]